MESDKYDDKFFREKVNRDIIMKYMFLESLGEQYGDEYIMMMYKINSKNIRALYGAINEDERVKVGNDIKKEIESKKLDLNKKAVEWHKEALRKESERDSEGEER